MTEVAKTSTSSSAGQPCAEPLPTLRERLLALSRTQKRILQLGADIVLIWVGLLLAFYMRLDDLALIDPLHGHAWLFLMAPIVSLPIFVRMGLYRAVMRYLGYQALITIAIAVSFSSLIIGAMIWAYPDPAAVLPRSLPFIYWLIALGLIGGLRIAMRQYFRRLPVPWAPSGNASRRKIPRIAIYGAGAAGNQLLMALRAGRSMQPVAFIDDDPDMTGRVIAGLPVYGPDQINRLIDRYAIEEILLAIPSAPRSRRIEIIEHLADMPLRLRTIPGFADLASGKVQVQDIREVDICDLLGRTPVQPDRQLLDHCTRGKTVMVTGAGGSIGSELCRQIMNCGPHTLILYEQCEYNLYSIQSELEAYAAYTGQTVTIEAILSTVRDESQLFEVMSAWRVDTVYHAAAYKHVPMVERNCSEGIFNNIFGTLYSAQAAVRAQVANFVLISTDKAVRPTNIMGSTKRVAELVIQALSGEERPDLYRHAGYAWPNRTRFTMVRFGNVLGSSGSVIPKFRQQIASGGPVTVTHPDITRYFMTIPEASQLVIQAGALSEGGDVFVLDMGEPVKVAELATRMIQLSGLTVRSETAPDGDIAIEYMGLRPGEKLYEELLIGDNTTPTCHPRIMRANEKSVSWASMKLALAQLELAAKTHDHALMQAIFLELVDGYQPDGRVVDWTQSHRKAA